jgi:hypothetical protein
MDASGWTPVTDAAGELAGWMCAPDPGERDADWFEADRLPRAGRRAAAIGGLADALAVESLDIIGSCDASGLPDSEVDAATYVALTLRQIEWDRDG